MNRLFLCFVALFFLSSCIKENSSVELTVKSYQVSVLKNLKENPVLQFNLQLADSFAQVITTSVTVNLEGTNELTDIKFVRIWYSENDSHIKNLSYENLFGEEKKPAKKITFTGEQQLTPGENYFWIFGGIKRLFLLKLNSLIFIFL